MGAYERLTLMDLFANLGRIKLIGINISAQINPELAKIAVGEAINDATKLYETLSLLFQSIEKELSGIFYKRQRLEEFAIGIDGYIEESSLQLKGILKQLDDLIRENLVVFLLYNSLSYFRHINQYHTADFKDTLWWAEGRLKEIEDQINHLKQKVKEVTND